MTLNISTIARRLIALLIMLAAPAAADEFRPAYLQLREVDATTYDVVWKVPAIDELTTLKVSPQFPPGTRWLTPIHSSFAGGTAVLRSRIAIDGGLDGKPISFSNLSTARVDVLVRLARADGTEQLERVLPAEPHFVPTNSLGKFEVARTYSLLGIDHILTGFDHLLFVLALILIVSGTRRLLLTVTAFTAAHSITLALATLRVVDVAGPPVEAVIALSIVFVASEIVQQQRGRGGLASRRPWLIAFAFGLLHGLGFAGALAEVGLPQNAIPLALLFFNIGVEIGQLLFVAAVLAVGGLARVLFAYPARSPRAVVILPYLIGGIASYWVIERTVSFWA